MKKEQIYFHKEKIKKSEIFSEKIAKELGLTKEDLRQIAKEKKKH